MCWRQDPKQRVSAAEVVDYLTREPTALSPTIGYEEDRSSILARPIRTYR